MGALEILLIIIIIIIIRHLAQRAHCTHNKSVTTLRYTRRHGPVYTMSVGTYRVQSAGFPKIVY